jgi:uncharacterized membrane protein YfcA
LGCPSASILQEGKKWRTPRSKNWPYKALTTSNGAAPTRSFSQNPSFATLSCVTYLPLFAIGLIAGVLAGMFGIGGGLVIVPALLFFVKMNELEAIGTSLAALIPPVGLLGAIEYYRKGYINVRFAAFIALGLFVGAYFGAKISMPLSPLTLRRVYAAFLIVVAGRMMMNG